MTKNESSRKTLIRYVSDLEGFFNLLKSDPFFQTTKLEQNQGIHSPILWFRGHENTEYILQPNLYRKIQDYLKVFGNSNTNFWGEIKRKELQLIEHFKVRNYHLIEKDYQDNDLLWLCTMQHFGTATRFLDWSETATAGLFFALEKYIKEDTKDKLKIPCVWVLKPEIFNLLMFQKNRNFGLHINNRIPSLIELANSKAINKIFIAAFSPYNNERVKAQSGAFVLFPVAPIEKNWESIEHCLESLPDNDQFLLKIVLLKPEKTAHQLVQIGMKSSQYYPDMPSISKEVEKFIVNEP